MWDITLDPQESLFSATLLIELWPCLLTAAETEIQSHTVMEEMHTEDMSACF